MYILKKSIKLSWQNLFWVGLGILCLIGWLNLSQIEPASAHRFADVNVDLALDLESQPTYCPESGSENGPCTTNNDTLTGASDVSGTDIYLPIVMYDYPVSHRLGFGFTRQNGLRTYPEIDSLRAGWYVDWQARKYPPLPLGIEYVQMVHIHQVLDGCEIHTSSDRTECPYVEPHEYQITSPKSQDIPKIARLNPGSIWLVGNEMERLDWGTEANPGGQDEILPTLYPVAYHDIYHMIKEADPTARVAIGGVIQPTPLRLQYLSIVWDTYQELYGKVMPVDVWNTHNFIIREKRNSWGAEIPVGVPAPTGEGLYVNEEWKHIDMDTFDQQIRALRLWMKDRGQQNKPLIVSEYGVLLPNNLISLSRNDQKSIQDFMIDTFDYYLNTKDCSIGFPGDDCRLVQRWNWYSLDDDSGFTTYARLYDPKTKELTAIGEKFRDYSQDNMSQLSYR